MIDVEYLVKSLGQVSHLKGAGVSRSTYPFEKGVGNLATWKKTLGVYHQSSTTVEGDAS